MKTYAVALADLFSNNNSVVFIRADSALDALKEIYMQNFDAPEVIEDATVDSLIDAFFDGERLVAVSECPANP